MKILLINGSPHTSGACKGAIEIIKKELLSSKAEFAEYNVGNAPRYACSGCMGCKGGNGCVFPDISELVKLCLDTDAIAICTPTHYAGAPGNLTAILSRLVFSSKKLITSKPIGVIGIGRRGGIVNAVNEVEKFFKFASCPIISGGYPTILYSDSYETTTLDEEGVQNIRSLISNLIYVTRCIKIALENGITPPTEEIKIKTDISTLKR